MKKLLLAIFALFITLCVNASHLVGGDLHYVHLGGDQYLIILKVYRDCENSSTDFDSPASVGIFNNGSLVYNCEMYFSDAVISDIPANANDPCLIPPNDICVKEAVYTKEITLPYVEGGYVLAYQRCCRTAALVNTNSFDDIGMTLTTTIPDHELVGYNSNPDFLNFPPIAICLGSPFTYDHSAIDVDGDSLSYEFCNPLLGGGFGNYYLNPPNPPPYAELNFTGGYSWDYPLASDPAFAIDPVTGLLTGTPTEIGVYVVGVCIKEWRDGEQISITNRDFQFNVVLCGSTVFASIDDDDPCDDDLIVNFTNNAAAALNYYWDFGDPSTEEDFSTEWSPSYEYANAGEYAVSLIVNEGLPCQDTAYLDVESFLPPPSDFEVTDFYCDGGAMVFNFEMSEENEEGTNFYWFFGSGSSPLSYTGEFPPEITYDEAGDYYVTVTVVDSPCTVVGTMDLVVEPFPVANIGPEPDSCQGLTIDFGNLSTGAVNYLWNFGDPTTTSDVSVEETPSYTYPSEGIYEVTLIVNQGTNCETEQIVEVGAFNNPEANFTVVSTICEDGNLILGLEASDTNDPTAEYLWDFSEFAEPSSSDEIDPGEIVFNTTGSYTINLYVEDGPCDASFSDEIQFFDIPVAAIAPQTSFCDGLEFTFGNNSVNAGFYSWDFGDEDGTSFATEPTYTFDEFGTYEVVLTASTVDCDAIDVLTLEVLPVDPIDFSFDLITPPNCEESTAVSLIWTGEGADEVTWDMGDGTVLNGFNEVYDFNEVGYYTVTATALHELCEYEESGSDVVEIAFFVLKKEIFLPNIFTPNDDDFNSEFRMFHEDYDTSYPDGKDMFDFIEDYSMKIFDRWGSKVFDTDESSDDFWDGSDVAEGTYYYIVTYNRNCMDDEIQTRSGYFQLLR